MLLQKTVTGPSLASGAFTQEFGEFVNIVSAMVAIVDPFTSSTEYAVSWAITNNNTLVITIKTQNLSSPGSWGNAGSFAGIVTMLVDGE